MTKKIVAVNLKKVVDELGSLKAKISELTKQEKKLKDVLVAVGAGEYDGETFRATVSTYDRESLDMEAVRAKLTPQFIAAHTDVTECTTVRVVARVRE